MLKGEGRPIAYSNFPRGIRGKTPIAYPNEKGRIRGKCLEHEFTECKPGFEPGVYGEEPKTLPTVPPPKHRIKVDFWPSGSSKQPRRTRSWVGSADYKNKTELDTKITFLHQVSKSDHC